MQAKTEDVHFIDTLNCGILYASTYKKTTIFLLNPIIIQKYADCNWIPNPKQVAKFGNSAVLRLQKATVCQLQSAIKLNFKK